MIRLAVVVEGQTEEEFVKTVVAMHLQQCGIATTPILIGRARNRRVGGGHVTVDELVSEMTHLWKSFDAVTSLVDFYGFDDKREKSAFDLERLVGNLIDARVGWQSKNKVIPYVQNHEFEGLLFSNVSSFQTINIVSSAALRTLEQVRIAFRTPEDINDNWATAPSRRILNVVPQFRKPLHGPLIARDIGLDKIREECPRFDAWIANLEQVSDRI